MPKKIVLIIVILLLAGGVGYYIYRDLFKSHQPSAVGRQTEESKSGFGSEPATTTITEIKKPVSAFAPIPNLNRQIPAGTSQSVTDKINELSAKLKEDNTLFGHWLELGIYRKSAKDYEGAIEAWKYASLLDPKSYVPFNNIGDTYAYFIRDNKKAEEYLLKAILAEPNAVYPYYKMASVYVEVIKDIEKARDILRKGIEANPNNSQDLQKNLDSLSK